jgi:hypothetical protein
MSLLIQHCAIRRMTNWRCTGYSFSALVVLEELIIAYYSKISICFRSLESGAEVEVMRQKLTWVRHKVESLYNLTSLFLCNKSVTKRAGVVVTILICVREACNQNEEFLVFIQRLCQMGASIRPRPLPDHIAVTTHPTTDAIMSEVLERRKIKE